METVDPLRKDSPSGSRKISAGTLKVIALVLMLIDHAAVVLMDRGLFGGYTGTAVNVSEGLYSLYSICRLLGRPSFLLFCFLISEGLGHTRCRGRYALRLSVFALISEIPFNLAVTGRVLFTDLTLQFQNVFFTLAIAVISVSLIERIRLDKAPVFAGILKFLAGFLAVTIAGACHTDYGGAGVLCIYALYFIGKAGLKIPAFIAALLALVLFPTRYTVFDTLSELILTGSCSLYPPLQFRMDEVFAAFAFFPISFYSGEKGRLGRWFFYIFYPAHLLVLYAICRLFILK